MIPLEKNYRLGLLLSLCSVLLWGFQPLALSSLVTKLLPASIAFYKLSTAALGFSLVILAKKPSSFSWNLKGHWLFLFLAGLGLSLSTTAFNTAYLYVSSSNTQIYFLLSRILLALAGVFIFKERFSLFQWLGLIILVAGLGLFYREQLVISGSEHYLLGVGLLVASAFAWAMFAIMQKSLLAFFPALQILGLIYIVATILFLPFAQLETLAGLSLREWIGLIFVCASNLLAFWFFTESMRHWEAAKLSAISCLSPFVTIMAGFFMASIFGKPILAENLSIYSIMGAALVVGGAALVSFSSSPIKELARDAAQ